ncbi:class I mannose-6-phosphate isomerase [Muricauda brasiliensis]|uniref:class I mannose-6-phosphate isomerase n=1 Tax=Muricauda brasiliensis TaxID=2162892 RepID=UPI001F42B15C|nr:class I mannose-6-phosphate isomerase [Muricauda brasiliensis]
MESGKIFEGYEGLADFIIKHKTVCLDGFSGVAWEIVVHKICDAVKSNGFTVNAIAIKACLKDENKIASMVDPFLGEEESVWGRKCDFSLLDYFDREKLKTVKPNNQSVINIVYGSGASLVDWDCPLVYFDLPKNELQYRMRAGSVTNLGISTSNVDFKMYKHYYFIDWVVLNQEKERLASKIDVIVDAQFQDTITWSHMNDIKEALKVMAASVFRVRPWFEPGAWGGEWIKGHIPGLNKDVVNYAWAFSLIVPENGLLFESDGNLLEISFDFLMNQESKNVLGKHQATFGIEFPIRFNFLDTYEGGNLSIQCHPSLTYIQEEFGENITQDECYYILDCKEDASVYLGFQENIDSQKFKEDLERSQEENIELDIVDYVQKHPSKKHELYLIPNGTVHSAGSGNMVLEISATPYIFTFKMYDWLRLDLNGKPRPINIEHAFKNLNFDRKGENVTNELFSKTYVAEETSDHAITNYPTHPDHFYDVRRLEFDVFIERSTENSCQVMMLVEGDRIQLETENGHVETLAYAETFVVPAAAKSFKLKNLCQGRAKVINAFLK